MSLTKIIQVEGKKYISLPQAAEMVGVSHPTLWRWCKEYKTRKKELEALGLVLDIYQDPMNNYRYISIESVKRLRERFVPV